MKITEWPHELLRLVGSYLDMESRISFNRVTTHIDDRFVRSMKDVYQLHNYAVWHNYIHHKMDRMEFHINSK